MDIKSGVENESYLFFCGPPFKSMCYVMTLKSGVLTIAIFDIIFGIFYFINYILELWRLLSWGSAYAVTSVLLFQHSLGMVAIFHALRRIQAPSNDFIDLVTYSKFKTCELITQSFLKLLIIFLLSVYDAPFYRQNFTLLLIIIIIERIIALPLAKVVWSANKRATYNEISLVEYGEETARRMQLQSNNFVAPQVAFSGMNPYFAGPYSP